MRSTPRISRIRRRPARLWKSRTFREVPRSRFRQSRFTAKLLYTEPVRMEQSGFRRDGVGSEDWSADGFSGGGWPPAGAVISCWHRATRHALPGTQLYFETRLKGNL